MLPKVVCLIFLLYFGNNFCSSQNDLPEIDTPLGRVQGFWKTLHDREYAAFEGIPYAKPPVGDLRFEKPVPFPAWSETWYANSLRTCLQAQLDQISGEEDCLYINVYIPKNSMKKTKTLDVLVGIHGDGFMTDNGYMTHNSNLKEDVVLVTFNYRLGILGFLSTENRVIPGNYGLKDQVLALKWVRDNIASFGGNPHSVTIVGVSAGGTSVHLHYFSPLSKGLFARGVSQSGIALAPWTIKRDALQRAKTLAVLVGCPDSPLEELKSCIKQRPANVLLKQLGHFYDFDDMQHTPFGPTVEMRSTSAFLEAEPSQLFKEGKFLDVPWMTSFTVDKGQLPAVFLWQTLDVVDLKWSEIVGDVLYCNNTIRNTKREAIAEEVLDYYLGSGEKINTNNISYTFSQNLQRASSSLIRYKPKPNKSIGNVYISNYSTGGNKFETFIAMAPPGSHEGYIDFYGTISARPFSGQDKRLVVGFVTISCTLMATEAIPHPRNETLAPDRI